MDLLNFFTSWLPFQTKKNALFQKLYSSKYQYQYDTESIAIYQSCVRLIVDSISKLEIDLLYKDKEGVIRRDINNPLHYMMRYKPNNYMNSLSFFQCESKNFLHNGDTFNYIHRDMYQRPLFIEPIANKYFIDYDIIDGQLSFYFEIDNQIKKINSYDIIHFKLFSDDGILGTSYVNALRHNLDGITQSTQAFNEYYKNGIHNTKTITTDIRSSNVQELINVQDGMNKLYAGTKNTNKTMFLPQGFEVKDSNLDFKDAIFISSLKYNSSVICSLFGISTSLLNLNEAKQSTEQEMLNFYNVGLAPILKMIETELTTKLLTPSQILQGKQFKFNVNNLFKLDINNTINYHRNLYYMGVEGSRDIIDSIGILDIERFENDDKHLSQGNLQLLSQLDNQVLKDEKKPDNKI